MEKISEKRKGFTETFVFVRAVGKNKNYCYTMIYNGVSGWGAPPEARKTINNVIKTLNCQIHNFKVFEHLTKAFRKFDQQQ